MTDNNVTNNSSKDEIKRLEAQFAESQKVIEEAQKKLLDIAEHLCKEKVNAVVPKETTTEQARKMGPMDDAFFNVLADDPGTMEEIISAVLGVAVKVKRVIPQYVIAGFGTRGVRLDAFSEIEPVVVASAELLEDSVEFGEKGALVDVEVQKQDRKDTEYRVYYNGASVIVQNTPSGIRDYRKLPRAIVIWISSYDPFDKGKMYYLNKLVDAESGDARKRPVSEIYINTEHEDTSDEKMSRISKMMGIFKNPDEYDDIAFPRLSERKRNLKTEKGVMDVSKELQQYMDSEKAEAAAEAAAEATAKERKSTTGLMAWLASEGRTDDIVQASQDDSIFDKLLAEFLSKSATSVAR